MASILCEFEIILTYEIGQSIFDILIPRSLNEEQFVLACFGSAESTGRLVKISSCMTKAVSDGHSLTLGSNLPDYLASRNGKYYFNTEVNKDDDTARWRKFRDEYIVAWEGCFKQRKSTVEQEKKFKESFYSTRATRL